MATNAQVIHKWTLCLPASNTTGTLHCDNRGRLFSGNVLIGVTINARRFVLVGYFTSLVERHVNLAAREAHERVTFVYSRGISDMHPIWQFIDRDANYYCFPRSYLEMAYEQELSPYDISALTRAYDTKWINVFERMSRFRNTAYIPGVPPRR